MELINSENEGIGLLLKPAGEKGRKPAREDEEVSLSSTSSISMSITAEGIFPNYSSFETYGRQFLLERREKKKTVGIEIPELENINMSSPVLTSRIRHLVRNFWCIVTSKAMQAQFPINKTAVSIVSYPDEEQKVVLKLFAEVNAPQAMGFWESLDNEIGEWIGGMNEIDRLQFLKTISLRIHWQ